MVKFEYISNRSNPQNLFDFLSSCSWDTWWTNNRYFQSVIINFLIEKIVHTFIKSYIIKKTESTLVA